MKKDESLFFVGKTTLFIQCNKTYITSLETDGYEPSTAGLDLTATIAGNVLLHKYLFKFK